MITPSTQWMEQKLVPWGKRTEECPYNLSVSDIGVPTVLFG